MRTFIAIDLPELLKKQMGALQVEIQGALGEDGALNWANPQKMHVTLRFLGETDDRQRDHLAHRLKKIAQDQSPFDLHLVGIGAFPNWPRMRVLWTGIEGDLTQLKQLQAEVEKAAQACGFAAEERAFSPHITLARVDRNAATRQVQHMGEFLRGWAQTSGKRKWGSWRADELIHMRSQLQPDGAVYTPLRHFPL
ncbi:MAG: RNA 2',3'-cyclic phosphodiesterase [Caldilineaceae bacterium]|nr:RNA 2',3'-cyclic phosphodiesterase [Caldilineaceae bacterium]